MSQSYPPLDSTPYPRDSRSREAIPGLPDGNYVFVQDEQGVIFVLPDGPHIHPRVLGAARSAKYAGDLRVADGTIVDVTNLSGTFQCDDPIGLREVASVLRSLGFVVRPGAVRFFPQDGSRPRVLE